ncbi:MAG: hypothetical protein EAZ21_13900 [Betaproteobacteria bacterium]|nr:MAG: hypothetical protein EAZ21_13900 [Betaproteobacteria bacterium]
MTSRDHLRTAPFSVRTLAFAALCAVNAPVHALSLGGERVTSFLGQPLRIEIPIQSSAGEDSWDLNCFALAAAPRAEGVALLRQGRIELSADRKRLIVRTYASVDDPALKFAVDVGCDSKLRREYTVLLDPAPAYSPATLPTRDASAEAPSRGELAPATASPPIAPIAPIAAAASTREPGPRTPNRASSESESRRKSAANAGTAPRSARSAAAAPSRLVVKGSDAAIDAASLAALAVPRLRISGDLPPWAGLDSPVGPAGAQPLDELAAAIAKERRARLANAPIEEDLPARLEADLVVAKKRIAELQLQLSAASPEATGAKTSQSSEAKLPETSSPPTKVADASSKAKNTEPSFFDLARDWMWIPALLAVAGLIGYLVTSWRRQKAKRTEWASINEVTVVQRGEAAENAPFSDTDEAFTESGATQRLGPSHADAGASDQPLTISPLTGTAPASESTLASRAEAKARLDSPLFHLNQSAAQVDVSELSQVTDEAQVYADLGRTNEAIEILAHHIDSVDGDRPSPAPWLMMFDLFRKANRRADYDRLAPKFRKLFNGRLPEWDDYGRELALDDGLEAFPHLVSRIERDWGTAEVRPFLDELLYDNRGGSRLGFSLPAYRDLLLLLQVHDQLAMDQHLSVRKDRESPGANDNDGTPKWDLSLEMMEAPKPGELDAFLKSRDPS